MGDRSTKTADNEVIAADVNEDGKLVIERAGGSREVIDLDAPPKLVEVVMNGGFFGATPDQTFYLTEESRFYFLFGGRGQTGAAEPFGELRFNTPPGNGVEIEFVGWTVENDDLTQGRVLSNVDPIVIPAESELSLTLAELDDTWANGADVTTQANEDDGYAEFVTAAGGIFNMSVGLKMRSIPAE